MCMSNTGPRPAADLSSAMSATQRWSHRRWPASTPSCIWRPRSASGWTWPTCPTTRPATISAPRSLLGRMATADVGRLVLASSMVVYGEGPGRCAEHGLVPPAPRSRRGPRRGPLRAAVPAVRAAAAPALVDEDAPLDPRNAYAASKVAQEHLARSWARRDRRRRCGAALPQRLRPGHAARHPVRRGGRDLHVGAAGAAGHREVFEDGGAAARLRPRRRRRRRHRAPRRERPDDGVRAYNVGSGTPRTVGEMAQRWPAAAGGPAPVVTGRYRLGDVRHITADSSRVGLRRAGPTADIDAGVRSLSSATAEQAALAHQSGGRAVPDAELAAAGGVRHIDGALVRLDDAAGDRQPQPGRRCPAGCGCGPARRGSRRRTRAAGPRRRSRRTRRARVTSAAAIGRVVEAHADLDRRRPRRVCRIALATRLVSARFSSAPLPRHLGRVRRPGRSAGRPCGGQRLQRGHAVGDQVVEADPVGLAGRRAGLDPREVEQVVDHAGQPVAPDAPICL